ncbi:MAG: potassium transporter TrkG [Desulfobacterales bacterium]|jgi:trk system potassium uptake protein TrkH|nr:potassium transporter TrkG [Desulfobacterales bacterium]
MTLGNRVLKQHPATLVLLSFLLVIGVGTLLLKLPFSTNAGTIAWVDALFTATSAVCVTGLVVVDTGSFFTGFGQGVILLLIQIGGLGLMTISVTLFQWLGRSVSIRQRMAMQDLFAHTPREDIYSLVKSIVFFTLGAELFGAMLLTLHWYGELGLSRALYAGIFHSVSAFCNAGFALFPDSLMRYDGAFWLNVTVCGLIVVGGIGFPVLYELQARLRKRKKGRTRLTVHAKTVVLTTLLLIVSGALMFAVLEWQFTGTASTLSQRFWRPVFQSITCRTAGFNTVDIGSLQDATLAMMIFLMFFGASPGSCGGGVKTTTLALIIASVYSRFKRRGRVNLFKKSIPAETVSRSVSLMLISVGMIGIVFFLLLAGNSVSGHHLSGVRGAFLPYLFETVSAFGTVGLSMGVTPELNTWGKCWIILMMIVGRVGILTFSYIIVGTGATSAVEHSEENLMIG